MGRTALLCSTAGLEERLDDFHLDILCQLLAALTHGRRVALGWEESMQDDKGGHAQYNGRSSRGQYMQ